MCTQLVHLFSCRCISSPVTMSLQVDGFLAHGHPNKLIKLNLPEVVELSHTQSHVHRQAKMKKPDVEAALLQLSAGVGLFGLYCLSRTHKHTDSGTGRWREGRKRDYR